MAHEGCCKDPVSAVSGQESGRWGLGWLGLIRSPLAAQWGRADCSEGGGEGWEQGSRQRPAQSSGRPLTESSRYCPTPRALGLSTDSGGSPAPGSLDRLHSAAQTPELRQRQGHRAINGHLRTTKPGFWARSRPAPQTSQEPLLSLPLEGGPGGTQPGAPRELPREGLRAPLAPGQGWGSPPSRVS